eukprot:COSAG04_NODE_168_length_21684_cov_19.787121_7_plen_359_part_00
MGLTWRRAGGSAAVLASVTLLLLLRPRPTQPPAASDARAADRGWEAAARAGVQQATAASRRPSVADSDRSAARPTPSAAPRTAAPQAAPAGPPLPPPPPPPTPHRRLPPCSGGQPGRWVATPAQEPGVVSPDAPLEAGGGRPLPAMWEPEPSATCQYRHFTLAEAAKTLAKQQLVFAGDSMMRKLWYTFVHLILDPPGARPGQRVATKKDKTIVYSPALRTSGQFLWAPYGRRHNAGLGGDTRTVFPYDSVLHELYTGAEHPKPAGSHPAGTAAKGSGVACERPCLLARSSLQPGDERLCSVGIGSGKHEQWQRFCEPPTTIVLHVGLWMTESWEENVADFAGYLLRTIMIATYPHSS